MKASEALIGEPIALVEPMDDERTNEIRSTFYELREGTAVFSPKFLTAYRLRTIQGMVDSDDPPRFDTGLHKTATEIPMTLPVVRISKSPWGKFLNHSGYVNRKA